MSDARTASDAERRHGAAAGVEAAVLDAAALARLAELDPGGGRGLVRRVLQTYAASLDKLAAELAQARRSGQREVALRVAHTLKSSSASVGALAFAALCGQVEAALRAAPPSHGETLLDALQAESERVARAVQARLAAA